MALVPKGNASGYFIGLTIMDTQGDTTRLQFETSATTEAEAQVILDLIYAEFVLLSAGQIVATTLRKDLVETLNTFPPNADVSIRAKVTVVLTGGQKKAILSIPAPAQGLFTAVDGPNNNVVDVENQNLLDLIAIFGAVGPGNGALISDGETIDVPLKGRRVSISRGVNS